MRSLVRSTLALFCLLLFASQAHAALTVSSRGTGGNNTGATGLTVTPGSNFTAGSLGVLVIALDNSGSAGANTVSPATATDSASGTWTRQQNGLFDNGAASAGAEVSVYTIPSTSLTTAGSITVTFSNSVTAKAWALWEVTADAGKIATYLTGGVGTGATSNPTVTTSSITSGDAVIGVTAAEASAASITGDADTTNGTWSTAQTAGFGSGTSGMTVSSQSKVTTATAAQTYNTTVAGDSIAAWVSVGERSAGTGNFLPFFQ